MTTTETLSTRIKNVIADHLDLPPSKVTDATRFIEDLGLDQLDTVEIVVALEEEFGIKIPDKDADAFETVAQIAAYISANVSVTGQGRSRRPAEASGNTAVRDVQFLDMITRELHGPLNTIKTHIESIDKHLSVKGAPNPALLDDYFMHIKPGIARLSGFVEDLVEVAKIEHGLLDCHIRPMQFHLPANDVLKSFEHSSEEQGVTLSNRIPASLEQVMGDPGYLRRALTHLVSNAIKFTPDGGEVLVQAEPREENGKRTLRVTVSDTGCGLDARDQKKFFRKFSQGNNALKIAGRQKGAGLGLFIVKAIIEAHKSSLTVGPRPGGGTQVCFDLTFVKH